MNAILDTGSGEVLTCSSLPDFPSVHKVLLRSGHEYQNALHFETRDVDLLKNKHLTSSWVSSVGELRTNVQVICSDYVELAQIIHENAPDAIKAGEIKNHFGRKVAIVSWKTSSRMLAR